jgi:hypothetical protein
MVLQSSDLIFQLSTVTQTDAQDAVSLHTVTQFQLFAALSFASVDFRSVAMVSGSMVSRYNSLLDSRSTHHVIHDRRLFCSYTAKSISVDTANCGSLEVLGIGDVEFCCPYHDCHVVFTLRGCLYAPDAPINLLSVKTLVAHGMSCLYSSGGLMKVFYP